MKLTTEQLAELARAVADTAEQEIDCDAFLDQAATLLEAASRNPGQIPDALRTVAQHVKVCPECREEFTLLLKAYGLGDEASIA